MLRSSLLLRYLNAPLSSSQIRFSTGEFGAVILPGKENKTVQADIVNYGSSGVYFVAYNQDGFLLNSGVKIVGPCAAFPRNAFCWNVRDSEDIDEASLSLFFILEPRLDMLIIGKGETSSKINHHHILDICLKHGIGAEIMPTSLFCRTVWPRLIRVPLLPTSKQLPTVSSFYPHNVTRSYSSIIPKEDQSHTPEPITSTKKRWPRQGDAEKDAITPPDPTVVASFSTADLIKDLFKGQLHLELLEFPELDNKKQVEELNRLYDQIKIDILKVNSASIDHDGAITETVLRQLATRGLLGMRIDRDFGGLGLNAVQCARAFEALGLDGSISASLIAHNTLAAKIIAIAGTRTQKETFLPRLASGQAIAAFCLTEQSSGNDLRAIHTTASPILDNNGFILNGSKTWVTNGSIADLLIVFARSGPFPKTDNDPDNISAFIVERKGNNIQSGNLVNSFGLRGCCTTDLNFVDVKIPKENLLGELNGGIELAQKVITLGYMDLIASQVGALRYLINYIAEYCSRRHQFGKPIGEYGLVQKKLSKATMNLYAMESGLFYLSTISDLQPSRDLSLEIAALKIFTSEQFSSALNDCLLLTGRIGLLKDIPLERFLRDSYGQLLSFGSNDVLRILIAGSGLRHILPQVELTASKLRLSGRHLFTSLKTKFRFDARKRGWFSSRVGAGPKVTEGNASRLLSDHCHPNFSVISQRLAKDVLRFQSLCEAVLYTYHQDVVDKQMDLGRIADCATALFLTTICLGRASRAISIGLPVHDYEIMLAKTFALFSLDLVEQHFRSFQIHDYCVHRIASELLTHRLYPVSHPMTRVW